MRPTRIKDAITRIWAISSPLIVLALAISAFTQPQRTRFAEIDVQRINVIEPDGKLRLVISNKERAPAILQRGQAFGTPGGRTGLLFYNDEGTENGGLIFSGQTVNGKVQAVGSLTFDQYEQDQTIALQYVDNSGHRRAGLAITDYPATVSSKELFERSQAVAAMPDGPEKTRARATLRELRGRARVYIGRSRDDGASLIDLADGSGRSRLRLRVDSAGPAEIQFLDESGHVVQRFPSPGNSRQE